MGLSINTWRFLIILLIGTIVLTSGCASPYPYGPLYDDGHSGYEYYIEIYTDHPIHNVTIIVPMPEWANTSQLNKLGRPSDLYQQYNEIQFFDREDCINECATENSSIRNPLNYSYSVISLQNTTYLKITTETLLPEKKVNRGFYYPFSYVPPYLFINTINPLNTEPVFHPKSNQTVSKEWNLELYTFHFRNFTLRYSKGPDIIYTTPVFVDYVTNNRNTHVTIDSSVSGSNGFYIGNDGGNSNKYSDHFTLNLIGASHGWYNATGHLQPASGMYPDWVLNDENFTGINISSIPRI